MKNKGIFLTAILTAVLCISGNLLAYSGDGDGSAESPYQISTIEDWQKLMTTPDDWNEHFILTADVNLAGVTLTPVGNYPSAPFTGVFDGNDNIISNAVINQPGSDYIGLFGYVGSVGQIRNLGVEDVNMTGSRDVGGLVGWNDGSITACYATGSVTGTVIDNYACAGGLVGTNYYGTLTACYATGLVTGRYAVGGLVGYNHSMLTDCYASGSVRGDEYFGGLVGYNNSGTITSCYATGSVSEGNNAGGLVGYNSGSITSCYATGLVTGHTVGGLVGWNYEGTLTGCYATGSVSGTGAVGGLMGYNDYGTGSITSCYATGSVTGEAYVGGLVGINHGTLTDCYATGAVSGNSLVGGLVGLNGGELTACFWDKETSDQTVGVGGGTSTGVTGKTTVQMKTLTTFTLAGWDFVNSWGIGNGQTYPYLKPFNRVNPADINYSGTVDFKDFAIIAENWLEGI